MTATGAGAGAALTTTLTDFVTRTLSLLTQPKVYVIELDRLGVFHSPTGPALFNEEGEMTQLPCCTFSADQDKVVVPPAVSDDGLAVKD
ncbi:hypothetical protein JNM87_06015 [Candidatus Saccharibacteria bacterium]|nr:hypothetical protein [Candidatus Saccharibacteria bacterium]